MNTHLKSALAIAALILASQAMAQVTFYENEGFRGRAFTTGKTVNDFSRNGFNDRASSVIVDKGRWEVCEDSRFQGRCVVLRKGNYESLKNLGLENRISSVRASQGNKHHAKDAPVPSSSANYDYRRRANEAVYQAPVTSVRTVYGPPNERCWTERQQANQPAQGSGMGAVLDNLFGGVIGYQANGVQTTDVKRCETTASTTPAYWDVTYNDRGAEHRMQTATAPGQTVAVNGKGEPRQ